jgi:hypothetical protein
MATESGGAERGYLHWLLADGARPFRFRGRIRTLLGLPESSGVQVNFSKPLPLGAFAYVLPRFSGEFEFPDELLAENPRRGNEWVEEIVPPGRRRPLASVDRGQTKSTVQLGAAARPTVPPSAQPDDAVAKQPKASEFKPSGEPAQQALGSHGGRYFPAYEVVVPGVHRQPSSMPPSQTGTHEVVPPTSQEPVLKPATSITPTPDPTPKLSPAPAPGQSLHAQGKSSQPAPTPLEAGGGVAPPLPSVPGSPTPHGAPFAPQARYTPSKQPLAKQDPAFHELPVGALPRKTGRAPGPTKGAFSPLPAPTPSPLLRTREAPTPAQPASPPPTPSRSALRQPDAPPTGKARVPAHVPFNDYRQAPPEAPANQTPSAPPASPPIVVVQPVLGAGMTPSAFWERRHLSHLKVRIRR